MKCWLVTVSAPYVGTDTDYLAYAESNPIMKLQDWFYGHAIEDLFCNYSHLAESDAKSYMEDGMSEDEAWDQVREDWDYDCNMEISEISKEEAKEYTTDIIYDERNNISSGNLGKRENNLVKEMD